MRGAQATERNKIFFRLFYRKENGKTINSKIPYFFNSFPLTIFYGAIKCQKIRKMFYKKRFKVKQTEPKRFFHKTKI
jgi:hypothetical protein